MRIESKTSHVSIALTLMLRYAANLTYPGHYGQVKIAQLPKSIDQLAI